MAYLAGLVVFPAFFSWSLYFAMRCWWSEPQSALGLVFADCIKLLHLQLQERNQLDFGIDHLVMPMCEFVSGVVEKGYLLWPIHSLGRIQLAFVLFHFVLWGQTCLLLQVSLDFLLSLISESRVTCFFPPPPRTMLPCFIIALPISPLLANNLCSL